MDATHPEPLSPHEMNEEIQRHIMRRNFGQALDLLVQGYGQPIANFCTTVLTDPVWAEEVAQDVFLAAYQAMPQFRGDASVQTWLYAIARNKSKQALWTNRRRATLMRINEEAIRASVHSQQGDDLAAEIRCIQYALGRLKFHERAFIQLHFLEERPLGEVAHILRVVTRTLARWRAPALLNFRKAYERCMKRES